MRGLLYVPVLCIVALSLAGCGSAADGAAVDDTTAHQESAEPVEVEVAAPTSEGAGLESVETSCDDYEEQVASCEALCEECQVSTPGNSCNICASECADQIFCERCGECSEE